MTHAPQSDNQDGRRRKQPPLEPDVLAAFLKRATELHGEGRFEEAARFYEHVEQRNPEVLAAPYFLALMDVELGNLQRALKRLRFVVRQNPDSFEAQYSLAFTFECLGLWPQTINAYRRALALAPDNSRAGTGLAHALEVSGQLDEAVAAYRELAEMPATRWSALGRIAGIKPAALTFADRAAMAAAAEDPDVRPDSRISLQFGLGHLLERQGDYDRAFAAFATGNRMKRDQLSNPDEGPQPIAIAPPSSRVRRQTPETSAQQHAAWIDGLKTIFTAEFIDRHAGKGNDSAAPIFILGMPRSGSTLIEQILSSHSRVQGLGECGALFETVYGFWPVRSDLLGADEPNHFRELGDLYLGKLRALGWEKAPFVIDKMLANYVYIGLIHLMFPRAKIIHSVRDPVETCLACFRMNFRTGNETVYDLADIGAHYVRYREMMAHWDEVLPGRVIPVQHEALVQDPDRMILWLVQDACGLKWDDACLRFYDNKRAVRTASVAQVRQPIFRTALDRWRRYETHLGPLFEALGPYAHR